MTERPRLIVAAGANGTGKSTFATEYLNTHPMPFLNADTIAKEMAPRDPQSARLKAGRQYLRAIKAHIRQRRNVLVESTLSGRSFARVLESAKGHGFDVLIAYVFLDSPTVCIARISERARKGGHHVEATDVRRRFRRSTFNFWHLYRSLSDRWHLLYNGESSFQSVAVGEGAHIVTRDEELYGRFLRIAGITSYE